MIPSFTYLINEYAYTVGDISYHRRYFNLKMTIDLDHKSCDGNKNELFFLLKINVDLSYAKLVKLLIVI